MSEEGTVFVRRASGLVREVGWLGSMSLPIAFAVGAGINLFAAQAIGKYPHTDIGLGLLVGGFPMFLLAVAMGFMAIAMPRTGGMYIFISRTIHPTLGMISIWGYTWAAFMAYGVVCYITSQFWGLGFYLLGVALHSSGLVALGVFLSKPLTSLAVGIIIGVAWWLIAILGMRVMSTILNILMIIPLIASVLGIAYLIGGILNPVSVSAAWDSVFGHGAWNAILTVASNHGWSVTSPQYGMYPTKWGPTWSAALVATWAYCGIAATPFIAGEVKNPSRNMILGSVLAPLLVVILYALMGYTLVGAYGPFTSAYEFIAGITPGSPGANVLWPEVMKLAPTYPSSPLLASIPLFQAVYAAGLGHAIAAAIIAFATAFWLLNGPPAFMLAGSRFIFAGAFDRLLPEKLAAVNSRFHSPHWAITLSAIFGLLYVVMNYFGNWMVLVGSVPLMLLAYVFASMTAIIFPYIRPDIWEKGFRLKVLGIPIVSILGIISFPLFLYQFLISIAQSPMGLTGIGFYTIFYSFFIILTAAYYAYNVHKGINVKSIYEEIPPA